MPDTAIVTFTARGPDRIIREHGSKAWKLVPQRAREAQYLVCTQNRKQGDWGDASEPHGEAFIIGRVVDVVPADDSPGRWLIQISEYARIGIPGAWKGWRYPVHYTTLEELGIDLKSIEFQPVPAVTVAHEASAEEVGDTEIRPLTIAEAKAGLAAAFKVSPDAIKITIEM